MNTRNKITVHTGTQHVEMVGQESYLVEGMVTAAIRSEALQMAILAVASGVVKAKPKQMFKLATQIATFLDGDDVHEATFTSDEVETMLRDQAPEEEAAQDTTPAQATEAPQTERERYLQALEQEARVYAPTREVTIEQAADQVRRVVSRTLSGDARRRAEEGINRLARNNAGRQVTVSRVLSEARALV
jgi:hypothetical protein